jgi:hypothetical protein
MGAFFVPCKGETFVTQKEDFVETQPDDNYIPPDKENPEEEVYDLLLKEEKVQLRDPQNRRVKIYTLRELDGEGRDQFMDEIMPRFKEEDSDSSGKNRARMSSYGGLESKLISLSLVDDEGRHVSQDVIKKWPASVQDKLFKRAQALSALRDEDLEYEAAKKNLKEKS